MSQFGNFLNNKRKEKKPKVSMRELARRTNVDASYISRIEKGEYIPSKSIVINLARALEEDETEFLINAGYSPDDTRFIEVLKNCITHGTVEALRNNIVHNKLGDLLSDNDISHTARMEIIQYHEYIKFLEYVQSLGMSDIKEIDKYFKLSDISELPDEAIDEINNYIELIKLKYKSFDNK